MNRRAQSNLDQLAAVCGMLEPLLDRLVLVGGCATALLITDTAAPDVRATLDVDLIVDVLSRGEYARLEAEMRRLGFQQSLADDVICRWRQGDCIVDVMPTNEEILGFSNRWYQPAIANSGRMTLSERLTVRHVTAPYFIATKIEAFEGRGNYDFGASHDMEDIIMVIDGRDELLDELLSADPEIRHYIAAVFRRYLSNDRFLDTLAWHLPPDDAGQARRPQLMQKLTAIAEMDS